MAQKTLRIDFNSAEFMLDLPTDTTILSATSHEGHLVLEVETTTEFPDDCVLVYEAGENGIASLTGAN